MSSELQLLSQELSSLVLRNTVSAISDRIRAKKAAKQDIETIAELEEIVNGLIEDKNELIRIARAFEESVVTQRLSDADVEYLTDNILPTISKLIEEYARTANADVKQAQDVLDMIAPLVSKEALTILQVIGLNFKRAIGEPLTELIKSFIASRTQVTGADKQELDALGLRRDILVYEMSRDRDASRRFFMILGRPDPGVQDPAWVEPS